MFYKSEIVPLSHIMAFPHCRQDEVPLPQHELQESSRVWLLRSSHTSNLVPSTPKHSVPWPHNGSLHSPPKSLSHCTHRVESDQGWGLRQVLVTPSFAECCFKNYTDFLPCKDHTQAGSITECRRACPGTS